MNSSAQRNWGIIRLALNTPILCPLNGRGISSRMTEILCKEALSTVLPSVSTGSNTAVGVRIPVLPIVNSISFNVVSTESFFTLNAIPFLLWCSVLPRDLPYSTSSNLNTTPSCGRCFSAARLIKLSILHCSSSF